MENQRIGESGLSESAHSNHHVPYTVLHGLDNPSSISFINQEGPAFDFGGLEEAIVLQGYKVNNVIDDAKLPLYSAKPAAATLEMFPSWPLKFHETPRVGSTRSGGGESTGSGSAVNTTISSKLEGSQFEEPVESPITRNNPSSSSYKQQQPHHYYDQNHDLHHLPQQQHPHIAADYSTPISPPPKHIPEKRRAAGSTSDRAPDAKTLRRLAQNREAAKKSRLRKKAYLQQLETSRIRLSHIEQDLQRARSQGMLFGGGVGGNISSGAAIFDMEYARWLDDQHKHMSELRAGLYTQLSDGDLRFILDGCIAHYDEIFQLKGVAAKSDVFHLINGLWTTPAERCFLWMGGFRPSELIKMLIGQLDPLTEQQLMGIYNLKHSSEQAEEALSQGLDQLQQSLIDTVASGSVIDGMHHMAVAIGKLTNLEGFVRQADNLRQQTLHQLPRILTVRQAAKCFLVIGEYYGRLRALSSLWTSRPREILMSEDNSCQITRELQMVQSSHNHFSSF
ncbi:hypothetical protein LguiB_031616 [Lonicera macranthoides]